MAWNDSDRRQLDQEILMAKACDHDRRRHGCRSVGEKFVSDLLDHRKMSAVEKVGRDGDDITKMSADFRKQDLDILKACSCLVLIGVE